MLLYLLPVLLATGLHAASVKTSSPPCRGPGDVVFAVDGSESVSADNFKRMIEFVKTNIKNFDIGPNKIRVGGLLYSSEVPDYFTPLDESAAVEARLSTFKQPRNGTRTDLAIAYLEQKVLAPGRTRVGVILTDGESKYPKLTASEAAKARSKGINLVAVGIGLGKTGKEELEVIAGSPALVKVIDNFKNLDSLTTLSDIRTLLCSVITTTTTTPSPIPVSSDTIIVDPLCEGCIIDNGFGYNHFEDDCSKFVQCYPSQDKKGNRIMTSAIKQCSYGTIWVQEKVTCAQSSMAECKYSICKGKNDGTTMPYLGCRTYWKCISGLPQEMCCAAGHHYDDKRSKCVVGIPDGCSGKTCGRVTPPSNRKSSCNKEAIKGEPARYRVIITKTFRPEMPCPGGTIFDATQCECVHDIKGIAKPKPQTKECKAMVTQGKNGKFLTKHNQRLYYGKTSTVDLISDPEAVRFINNDHINIWRLANYEFQDSMGMTFSVKLRPYTKKSGSETEQIAINCLHSDTVDLEDDCTASMSLQVKKERNQYTFIGELKTENDFGKKSDQTLSVTVPSNSGYKGYIDLVFAYDGTNFAMKADGTERSKPLKGWIQRRQTGFIFGRPMLKNGSIQFLDGYIKGIKIYDCISEEIQDALTIM